MLKNKPSNKYFYLHDRLGSVRQLINTAGQVVNYQKSSQKLLLKRKLEFWTSGKEVETAIVETIAIQTDEAQRTKRQFAAKMRFWDGFDTYSPFGSDITAQCSGSLANPFKYTGQFHDTETGQYFLRNCVPDCQKYPS